MSSSMEWNNLEQFGASWPLLDRDLLQCTSFHIFIIYEYVSIYLLCFSTKNTGKCSKYWRRLACNSGHGHNHLPDMIMMLFNYSKWSAMDNEPYCNLGLLEIFLDHSMKWLLLGIITHNSANRQTLPWCHLHYSINEWTIHIIIIIIIISWAANTGDLAVS